LVLSERDVLDHIAASLNGLRKRARRNGGHWSPELEAIRLLANSGQERPEIDGDVLAYDYEAVGKRLSISERSVRRLVAAGSLPSVMIGGSARITRVGESQCLDRTNEHDGSDVLAGLG
jgi:excisionase family DNA binding protein